MSAEQVWLQAFLAAFTHPHFSTSVSTAASSADEALSEFRKRFPTH